MRNISAAQTSSEAKDAAQWSPRAAQVAHRFGLHIQVRNELVDTQVAQEYSHGRNRGGRTGVGGEGREWRLSARLLNVVVRLASREVRAAAGGERRGLGNDLRAVDERALVDTEPNGDVWC